MNTVSEKAEALRQVIEFLEEADVLQQQVLGESDVCEENHNRIRDLIDDIAYDIIELEQA